MNLLTLVIVGLIVVIILGMGVAIVISNEKAKKERALAVIRGQAKTGDHDKGPSEREAQDKRRAEIAKKLKDSGELDSKKKGGANTMKAKLQQAGMNIDVKQFYIFSFIFSVVFTVVIALLGAPGPSLLFVWVIGFMGLPRMFIKRKIAKRQQKFLEEFGDALEAMVRLLKAGMPVSEAIAMAGQEFTGPVGEEMLQIYDAQKLGIPLPDAVLQAAHRMPITEMQMFATGIAIQAQTGSSLSEVLQNLANVIRSRFRLKRKVKALSAEAKASAMIIGSLPFLVGLGMYFLNPEYMLVMFNTTMGLAMTIGSGVWMMIGIFVMKAMINFKV